MVLVNREWLIPINSNYLFITWDTLSLQIIKKKDIKRANFITIKVEFINESYNRVEVLYRTIFFL